MWIKPILRLCVSLACVAGALTSPSRAADLTIINQVTSQGYQFVNFDAPNAGTSAATGTNVNGISNSGTVVGFAIDNIGLFTNFTANPLTSTTVSFLTGVQNPNAMAFGVNSSGTVVGTDGAGNAFRVVGSGVPVSVLAPALAPSVAFGINDLGTIVGQYTATGIVTTTPGFISAGQDFITINAPSGPNVVNAQGINSNNKVVGFYVGTDGQDHGFLASAPNLTGITSLTGTAVADPSIPPLVGEPGATFVFSQLLEINDFGMAVGYFGDSTTSQHGFLYNTSTGQYSFLDDPSMGFSNGVEVTQITGINDAGEITGFYSDSNGVFHGFVADVPTSTAVPEPGSGLLLGLGLLLCAGVVRQRVRRSA